MLLDRGAGIAAKGFVSNRIHVWLIVSVWLSDIRFDYGIIIMISLYMYMRYDVIVLMWLLIWYDMIWYDALGMITIIIVYIEYASNLIWFDMTWSDLIWLDLTCFDATWLNFCLRLYYCNNYYSHCHDCVH